MTPPRPWWRRAVATLKDHRSLCATKMTVPWRHSGGDSNLEAAVIRATSHDERSANQKQAGRLFAWAHSSPTSFDLIMQAITRRVSRTRSWPVALKALMLAHGLLLCCSASAATSSRLGLPFDLSGFCDRSAKPPKAERFSAFIRAYFYFLNYRYTLPEEQQQGGSDCYSLERLETMQRLLDLMMQIKPTPEIKMELVLEAMDCVLVEIFEVYSSICSGIASFLVGIVGLSSRRRGGEQERRRALQGIRVLRKAGEQCSQLSAYFEMCRELGILNTAEFPPVERIQEEDIKELEKMVMGSIPKGDLEALGGRRDGGVREEEKRCLTGRSKTIVTEKWEVFEDDRGVEEEYHGNPFVGSSWEVVPLVSKNSIEGL
ncbi:putative clathrin assembly protein At1g25240 [Elaeis guineensis]|uniref:Clathrin assembly protein At1g25240 n=1 Tax=Elaeis guineensis var. tenera TaxID=51953 RepID=A0A6I9S2Z9_ELAGV|nr:putative clathrin assembly protein At1g25240 [Elaeis guineensis]